MITLHDFVIFDISMVIAMNVLASLSKTIGEPLKIPPFYKLFYCTSVLIAMAAFADSVPPGFHLAVPTAIPMGLRCLAGLITIPVCLRYWKWLISEFFQSESQGL
jgi:hypothetical protein